MRLRSRPRNWSHVLEAGYDCSALLRQSLPPQDRRELSPVHNALIEVEQIPSRSGRTSATPQSTLVEGLPKSVAGIEIEDRLNLGSGFVGKINEGAAARHWHQHRDGSFLDCQLNKVERIVDNLN